jgi:hypothetical protein
MSTDPVPDPTAPEAASRIGDILATAERQVTEILAQADRQASQVHAESARRLQARGAELEEIAAGLVAAAAAAQQGLERLRALAPLDLPAPHADPAPSPGDPAPPLGAPASNAGATASTPGATAAPAAEERTAPHAIAPAVADRAVAQDVGARPDAGPGPEGDRNGQPSPGGAGILHRPAEWVGFGEPAGRPEPTTGSAPHDDHAASDAGGVDAGASAQAAAPVTQASPEKHADLPIIAQSDGAPYPQDPPEKIDSARLVALSMAANGRSREEVEAHVRDELGIVDHAALIDYVFGISAPSSIVPSWPPRRRRRGA